MLTTRFNDGNQCGHVKFAGPFFIAHVSKNGLHILWEKESYGDVPVVKRQARLCRMNIVVGVEKLRIRMWTDWLRHIVVPSHV